MTSPVSGRPLTRHADPFLGLLDEETDLLGHVGAPTAAVFAGDAGLLAGLPVGSQGGPVGVLGLPHPRPGAPPAGRASRPPGSWPPSVSPPSPWGPWPPPGLRGRRGVGEIGPPRNGSPSRCSGGCARRPVKRRPPRVLRVPSQLVALQAGLDPTCQGCGQRLRGFWPYVGKGLPCTPHPGSAAGILGARARWTGRQEAGPAETERLTLSS